MLLQGYSQDIEVPKKPNAGFDTTQYHPFYIKSSDDQFLLNLGLYTQIRYNANFRANTPDSVRMFTNGYNEARTRIFLEGDYTEKFHYHVRMNINTSNDIELMAAYLQWNVNKKMNFRFGKQFMALGREDWMYPCDLIAMEFSATDFTYAIWSSFGAQFHHEVSDKFRYWAGVGNGFYGARKSFPSRDAADVTLTSRVEFQPIGNWGLWGDMTGRKGKDFGVLLGLGGGYTGYDKETRRPNESTDAYQVNADISVNGDGYHLFAQYVFTSKNLLGDAERRTGAALYSTFGYWVSPRVLPYFRFDYVGKGNYVGKTENYVSPGFGVSYYPFNWTNRVRFTFEYNYVTKALDKTFVAEDGQLGVVSSNYGGQQSLRLQLQFGF